MDRATPESRERAASSEPCSTRPNPFPDPSARKRRRTSMSGASRSRSVDTIGSTNADNISPPTAEDQAQPDTAMKIDTDSAEPAAPQTPEQRQEQPEAASVDGKKITINLRSAQRPLETIPSSPLSPQSPTPATQQILQDEDVKISVEAEEPQLRGGSSCVGTPLTTSTGPGSPPIEEVQVDSDVVIDDRSVTMLHELQDTPLIDPSEDFPYKNNGDSFLDIMTKLSGFIHSHEDLANNLTDWIVQYLDFAQSISCEAAYTSFFRYRQVWQALPELVWHALALRSPDFGTTERSTYEAVLGFCRAFARLTAHFAEIDLATMNQAVSTEESQLREFISHNYLVSLFAITRRDQSRREDRGAFRRDDITEIVEAFQSGCASKPLGALQVLAISAQVQAELLPRFPKLADTFHHLCNMVSVILIETDRILKSSNLNPTATDQLRRRLQLGFKFFKLVADTLSAVIDKHVTHLSFDGAREQITALGRILQLGLKGQGQQANDYLEGYRSAHDGIDPAFRSEVVSFEWRFKMYRRLIMSGQMQLRVMAVTNLCTELVTQWKKYGESSMDQVRDEAVLKLFSGLLTTSGLVAYLLGPSCHPEIIMEAANIIGFLAVTKTYTNAHTDLLWATVTTTQDPRISDALVRMLCNIMHLFSYEALLYMCQQVSDLPVEAFSASMREFCDLLFRHLVQKTSHEKGQAVEMPFLVCLRLLRASSEFGQKGRTAHPDIQGWAQTRLQGLLKDKPLDAESRQALYRLCLQDISSKAATAMGSLWALHIISSHYLYRDIENLTAQHDLTTLLVGELGAAISKGKLVGYPQVIFGDVNIPRRELLRSILSNHPGTVTAELGPRLWDLLVGKDASCQEDRDYGWRILNNIQQHNRTQNPRYLNPFITVCFTCYLPQTPPDCFCDGLLLFLREVLLPQVNDVDSILLEDDEESSNNGIEQLWRIVLTAPEQTIERQAIITLVQDVYIASKAILAFPPHRARKIHLALASRCLKQLSSAATELVSRSRPTSLGPSLTQDESMSGVPVALNGKEPELRFIRSLAVLREFHWLYRSNANFAVPDLRSLRLESPGTVKGDSAELKFQSFDGDDQTDIKPLNIGKLNTTGSLLASLKAETGWENYRLYYRGNPLIPRENDICKSLAELKIHDGLILVKREADEVSTLANIRPGASPVEIEILSHFEEMWSYLSMEDRLAEEMYSFLVRLPVDDRILGSIQADTVPYRDIFPVGQPFKSLYGASAIREYLSTRRRTTTSDPGQTNPDGRQAARTEYIRVLARALSLTVAAICDFEVIHSCESKDLQISLSVLLLTNIITIMKDPFQSGLDFGGHDSTLLERLFQILDMAITAPASDSSARLTQLTFQVMLECASLSRGVWDAFQKHDRVEDVLSGLLIGDSRPAVRKFTAKLITDKASFTQSPAAVSDNEFCVFLWPVVERLIPVAMRASSRAEEMFDLFINMFDTISKSNSPAIDINPLLRHVSDMLLSYTTYEDITRPEVKDCVAWGLARMMFAVLAPGRFAIDLKSVLAPDYPQTLFWKHLFPPFRGGHGDAGSLPQVILSGDTRMVLAKVIFLIAKADLTQWNHLIENLESLVEYHCQHEKEHENPYNYELVMAFDRNKAIRSPCGYVGLKNLSNTCYLNSLFTQLFMNTDFRQFMLVAEIHDEEHGQKLLAQTRNLFGFLQDSYQRFYDPENCVASIRTYEDTTIDIHNQMDVDEFYNLLFDRWEGQLSGAETKKIFRAFYGGQLVQQVKSKECDHVSERLEPFSAIQCDIKGKNSLQESLQAYTAGEIMQGDNRYKCSDCDRHVDAVKRACLKDIPNNLIFHLKRFDFNLRTLQRAKINDRFEFPMEIDMQPYTIEQLDSPSVKHEVDLFELVGVLVHSGTAESGHYYSYIRERPSSSDKQVWIEFNDDHTSYWDPAQMQAACFGGETRSNFEINGSSISEKSYSAYMLFYQRSSSLDKVARGPKKCQIPKGLATYIRHENVQLVRRHCLYDPFHIPFVNLVLENMKETTQCPRSHETQRYGIERRAIHMALGHLDQVASRTKDLPDFLSLVQTIRLQCQKCQWCSLDIYEYFGGGRFEAFRQMVQRNPEVEVRQSAGALFVLVLQTIKTQLSDLYLIDMDDAEKWVIPPEEDASLQTHPAGYPVLEGIPVVAGALMMLRKLWDCFHTSLRSWNEIFGLMCAFVNLGRHELAAAMDQNFLSKAVQIITADSTIRDQPAQYQRLVTTLQRRIAARQPSYENIILLIHRIIGFANIVYDDIDGEPIFDKVSRIRAGSQNQLHGLRLNSFEYNLLNRDWSKEFGNIFIDKLISLNQNLDSTEAIIIALMDVDRGMDSKIQRTLESNISGAATSNYNTPYLRAAKVYVDQSEQRGSVQSLIRHVAKQCRGLANAEGRSFFDFLREAFQSTNELELDDPNPDQIIQGLRTLHHWVPGLLAYFEPQVAHEVELFVQENLFIHGVSPVFDEADGGIERTTAVDRAARLVGLECLYYVRDHLNRGENITALSVAALQRVVNSCKPYYNFEPGAGDNMAVEYTDLYDNIMEPLRRAVMEEDLEEDVSDQEWVGSDCSSEQVDSLGDIGMQTIGDLQDPN